MIKQIPDYFTVSYDSQEYTGEYHYDIDLYQKNDDLWEMTVYKNEEQKVFQLVDNKIANHWYDYAEAMRTNNPTINTKNVTLSVWNNED